MTHSRLEGELPDTGRQVVELTVPELVVGRRRDSSLVLDDAHVSRQHAKLIATPDGYDIVDLHSVYGTFVNDKRIERHRLEDGDRIRFAPDNPEFRYSAASQ